MKYSRRLVDPTQISILYANVGRRTDFRRIRLPTYGMRTRDNTHSRKTDLSRDNSHLVNCPQAIRTGTTGSLESKQVYTHTHNSKGRRLLGLLLKIEIEIAGTLERERAKFDESRVNIAKQAKKINLELITSVAQRTI